MLRVGQTWKDRRNKPTSTFTVLKLFTKTRPDGSLNERVKGVLVCGIDGMHSHLRDLHVESLKKMFPYILFEPEYPPEDEDK